MNELITAVNECVDSHNQKPQLLTPNSCTEQIQRGVAFIAEGIVQFLQKASGLMRSIHPKLTASNLRKAQDHWLFRLSPEIIDIKDQVQVNTIMEGKEKSLIDYSLSWMKPKPPTYSVTEEIDGVKKKQLELCLLVNNEQPTKSQFNLGGHPIHLKTIPIHITAITQSYHYLPGTVTEPSSDFMNAFSQAGTIKFTAENRLLGVLDPVRSARLRSWFLNEVPDKQRYCCWEFVDYIQSGNLKTNQDRHYSLITSSNYNEFEKYMLGIPFFYPLKLVSAINGRTYHSGFSLGYGLFLSNTNTAIAVQRLSEVLSIYEEEEKTPIQIGVIRCDSWPDWDTGYYDSEVSTTPDPNQQ